MRSVVLRPTIYLENLLHLALPEMRERGFLSYPPLAPERKVSWTALGDQAKIAIAAMTAETVVGKSFDIASPEPVTGAEITEMVSRKIGREISYEPPTPEQFGENMSSFAGPERARHSVKCMRQQTDCRRTVQSSTSNCCSPFCRSI